MQIRITSFYLDYDYDYDAKCPPQRFRIHFLHCHFCLNCRPELKLTTISMKLKLWIPAHVIGSNLTAAGWQTELTPGCCGGQVGAGSWLDELVGGCSSCSCGGHGGCWKRNGGRSWSRELTASCWWYSCWWGGHGGGWDGGGSGGGIYAEPNKWQKYLGTDTVLDPDSGVFWIRIRNPDPGV